MAACPRCQDPDDEADEGPLCSGCAPLSPGATLKRTLGAWSDHLPTLLLFWALPAAASTITRAGILVLHGDAFQAYVQGLQDVVAGGDPSSVTGPATTLAPWLLLDAVVTLLFFGAIHALARELARGDDPGPLAGLRVAGTRLLPILATGVLFSLAVGVGAVLLVLPGLVALHWFLLALPASGAGASPLAAFRRSRRLVREHGSLGFPALVLGIWFLVDSIAVGAGDLFAAAVGVTSQSLPAVLATGLAEWIVAPILPLFVATYHVHLEAADQRIQEASTSREEAGAADEAGRDDVVIGRCPDCGAFVPDDRSGEHPTCPTCGREGALESAS